MTEAVAGVATVDARPARSQEAPGWMDPAVPRTLVLVALAVTLGISRLPEIVARELLAIEVPWMAWATVVVTPVLWLASRTVAFLHPLERFLAVMITVTAAIAALPVVVESAAWKGLVPDGTNEVVALLATRVLYAAVGVGLLGWALVLGASRREAFLRVGDLNAPTRNRSKGGEPVRWRRFGPLAFVGLALLMVWFGVPMLPDRLDLADAAPLIAIGAVAAVLNAFWEEAAFRAAPLSMLQRAVGPGTGVLLLALFFGLGHFYGGIPSGPMGLIATGAVAVLLGRSMIETRGLGWPVALHFAIDFVIFTFIALGSVA